MGTNVDKLTKTNQDAGVLVRATSHLFGIRLDDVRLIENARKADFLADLQWLHDRAQPNDFVFIFFSGHGGCFRNASSDDGWDEYFVTYDFEFSQDPHSLVFSQQFVTWVNELPTTNVIAAIDACHSAGVFRSPQADVLGARSKLYTRLPEDEVARVASEQSKPAMRAASGRNKLKANGLLMAAARRDQSALEGSQGGFFTMALVRKMMSAKGGTLADTFARAVDLTKHTAGFRQSSKAVGDVKVAQHVVFQ